MFFVRPDSYMHFGAQRVVIASTGDCTCVMGSASAIFSS